MLLLPQASDRERLVHLESYLHERVVGQDTGGCAAAVQQQQQLQAEAGPVSLQCAEGRALRHTPTAVAAMFVA